MGIDPLFRSLAIPNNSSETKSLQEMMEFMSLLLSEVPLIPAV